MAVTISGFIIGKLLICNIVFLTNFFECTKPMAVKVPAIVDTTVEISAIPIETCTAPIISRFLNKSSYHLMEKLLKCVNDLVLLNENTIIITIGKIGRAHV